MKIHYNNTENEKLIDNVIAVQFDGDGEHVSCCTKSGCEYRIAAANVETIIDDDLTSGSEKELAEARETIKRLAAEKEAAIDEKAEYEMLLFEVKKALDKNSAAAFMLKATKYRNATVTWERPVMRKDNYCDDCVRKGTGACGGCIVTEHPSGRVSRPSHYLSKGETNN